MAPFSAEASGVQSAAGAVFEVECDVLVVGAGAAGLIAALRAEEAGARVLVLERDKVPGGSTALSAGLIPAAETRFQHAAGLSDSKAGFAADILAKAANEPDPRAVAVVVGVVGEALEWLADRHGLPFSVLDNFTYPGHSARRMHGLPSRSGAELMDRLRAAGEASGIDLVTGATATTLLVRDDDRGAPAAIAGVALRRPGGATDQVGCGALVLASNGYGGDRALVAAEIPAMADALYFGHPGNQGDALRWGRALGAQTRHLSGYQGHGSVAHPHGVLITWATIMEGGFQVNGAGRRFFDESCGYSEAAAAVMAQPGGVAWSVFDERIADVARQFEDFRVAEAGGAILSAPSLEALARRTGLPEGVLRAEIDHVSAAARIGAPDRHGRMFQPGQALAPPYRAVKVTGALFHTQGGLVVDHEARVIAADGLPFPNLFAAGGAACGVSGAEASGYLSGNGLLTAVSYGYVAGRAAARQRDRR